MPRWHRYVTFHIVEATSAASGAFAVVLAALALAWPSFRGSVNAAIAYGKLLRSAIDLHRFDLLQALHLPLPANPEAERTLNAQLSDLLRQDLEMQVQYAHASSAESAGTKGRPVSLPATGNGARRHQPPLQPDRQRRAEPCRTPASAIQH